MNNYTQNNQHGDNTMNFGSQPRELDINLKEQLDKLITVGSMVNITSVLGDGEAYNFASQIKLYLEEKGYKVNGVNQSVFSGPVSGQIIEPPKDGDRTFKLIIGNKQ